MKCSGISVSGLTSLGGLWAWGSAVGKLNCSMDSHGGGIRRSLPRMEGAGERVMGGSMVGSTLLGNEGGAPFME